MNASLPQVVVDTLEYLMNLSRDELRPEEARARLCRLQQCYPDTKMDLLWEEESYDYSVHYDTLLHLAGEGTISLSFCPDRALPWPMRGVQRWKEKDVVRVNSIVLQVDQAMILLDMIWDEARLLQRFVNACLIREELEQHPVEISEFELQCAMDGFRRAHKLYKSEDTYRWMERHGTTHAQLERLVTEQAMIAKLRDRVTASRVDEYFTAHRADFDTAWIAQFKLVDAESAQQTYTQIRSGVVDFFAAATHRFLEVAVDGELLTRDLFATIRRGAVEQAFSRAIFTAGVGEVVGPVRMQTGFAIVCVLARAPARLDESTRRAIKTILFEEWLAKRRQTARIEWYWGHVGQTTHTRVTSLATGSGEGDAWSK